MVKKCSAFTLFEILLSLVIMTAIIVFIAPTLKNNMIDAEEPKIQRTYAQILSVVQSMLSNTSVYPTADGFQNTRTLLDARTGGVFGGETKFSDMFKEQLNVRVDNVELYPTLQQSKILIACDSPTAYPCLPDATNRDIDKTETCFFTNDGTTFCLPKDTSDIFIGTNRVAVIKVYYKDNFSSATEADKAGYYFGINQYGKVSPMSVSSTVGSTYSNCETRADYQTIAQCRLDDYLTDR